MAISAIHHAGRRPGRNQAGHVRILADGLNGMEGCIAGIELLALVRLRDLARDQGRTAPGAVTMAAITNFVFVTGVADWTPRGRDAFNPRQSARHVWCCCRRRFRGMRVMTVDTRGVTR